MEKWKKFEYKGKEYNLDITTRQYRAKPFWESVTSILYGVSFRWNS